MRVMGTRRKYKLTPNGRKEEMTFNKQCIFIEYLFCARYSYRTPIKEKEKRQR